MIQDIDTFRKLIPTVTGRSFDKYEQSVADATSWFRGKIVGSALLADIELLPAGDSLFMLSQTVVAYSAYIRAIPTMDVIETDNGFAVVNDDKLAPASANRVQNLVLAMQRNLDDAIGNLVEYLEDTPEYHTKWSTSPTFSIMYDSYIPTLRMFLRFGRFEGSHFDFISAVPQIRGVIIKMIEPVISRELSMELLSQIRDNTLSEANKTIITDLRYALAAYYNSDIAIGESSLYRVRRILEDNIDDYPTFKNSSLYKLIIENSIKKEPHKSILSII